MPPALRILKIDHVGDSPEEDARVAISPGSVKLIASRDVTHRNLSLKQIAIHFNDQDMMTFNISGMDLMLLEEVVAGYGEIF